MIVGLYLQQTMTVGLVFTSYDYRYDPLAYYDCMASLRAIYDCRSVPSTGHVCMAELIAIYDCRNDRSGGRGCRVGSYKEL